MVCRLPGASHDTTASPKTIRTHRTRTLSLAHLVLGPHCSSGTMEIRDVVDRAKGDIDEIFLPADWAFGRVLRTHLSRNSSVVPSLSSRPEDQGVTKGEDG